MANQNSSDFKNKVKEEFTKKIAFNEDMPFIIYLLLNSEIEVALSNLNNSKKVVPPEFLDDIDSFLLCFSFYLKNSLIELWEKENVVFEIPALKQKGYRILICAFHYGENIILSCFYFSIAEAHSLPSLASFEKDFIETISKNLKNERDNAEINYSKIKTELINLMNKICINR